MHSPDSKNCQNCKAEFVIEPADFEFYDKMKVPAPTFCPECRLQRRLAFRNERILYRRECNLCKTSVVSVYHKDSPYTVYCQKCWWSDNWSPMDYGKEYNFSKPFFEQFKELISIVPRVSLLNSNAVNTEYAHLTDGNRDCYLLFESSNNERCDYSYWMQQSKDCIDCSFVNNSELCYETLIAWNCYKLFYSKECRDCMESLFLKDCVGCSNCYGCVGLRNKQYHVFNKPYSKEEYSGIIKQRKDEISNGNLEKLKKEFKDFSLKYFNKYAYIQKSVNSTGNYLLNVKNCKNCFHAYDAEDCVYGYHVWRNAKDVMDVCTVGRNAELVYETINTGMNIYNVKFGIVNWSGNKDLQYADSCMSSSDLFGCISLRNQQYCILNKQYTKDEYELLVSKIIEQMNSMPYEDKRSKIYKYGEFFPIELSPFAYNETSAGEHFPLSKEEIEKARFKYVDIKQYKGIHTLTIKAKDLSDHIDDVSDNILNEIIECGSDQCRGVGAFKIIKQELEFYRKQNIPLPRLCPDCRHYERIKQRNPLKLWKRKCQCSGIKSDNQIYKNTINHPHHNDQHCPNEFETTYAPERKEIVYCEKCYQQEVV